MKFYNPFYFFNDSQLGNKKYMKVDTKH